ncbi:MAG: hypothetical protein K6U89_11375 [Chloroflexi bacterium]|nr:hypothetical protein [Chloroflexota bacterium]
MCVRFGVVGLILALALLRLAVMGLPASGSSYFAPLWAVISGGGGTSGGAVGGQTVSLYGVIGQPVLGRSSGTWTVDAGFLFAAEQPFIFAPFTTKGAAP